MSGISHICSWSRSTDAGVSVSCCISSVVCGLECKLCLIRRCHKKLSDGFQFGGLWWLGLHITSVLWWRTVSTLKSSTVHIQHHILSVWDQISYVLQVMLMWKWESHLIGPLGYISTCQTCVFWSSGTLLCNNSITVVLSVTALWLHTP
jgi:hypothetical protein